MSEAYGVAMTKQGLALIAKIMADKSSLTLTRVMMGSGQVPEGVYLGDLEDLVEPVAPGTVSEPSYKGSTVEMTVEYRSDMNGGLTEGFIIREFGIFARDGDGEVMILYGNLAERQQYIGPWIEGGGNDVRRYPVSITIGEGTPVILDGLPGTVMTIDDVKDYCVSTLLPQLLTASQNQIVKHNLSEEAHPYLQEEIDAAKAAAADAASAAKTAQAAADSALAGLELGDGGSVGEAVEDIRGELDGVKTDLREELDAVKRAAQGSSWYRVFEVEDWSGSQLRIPASEHGMEPKHPACLCTVRQRVGRTAAEYDESSAGWAREIIVAAVSKALNANASAPGSWPTAEDGHVVLTWEQVQYALLESTSFVDGGQTVWSVALAGAEEAAAKAVEEGFNWQGRDNGAAETVTLDQLLTAAYLPALGGASTSFDGLCTVEALQGLRFRRGTGGTGAAAKYDLDGRLITTWGTMGCEAHWDLNTKELVVDGGPFAGDILVTGQADTGGEAHDGIRAVPGV